jgi:hypothetical protein
MKNITPYRDRDIQGSQRPHAYQIGDWNNLVKLWEGAANYFEEERIILLLEAGVDLKQIREGGYNVWFEKKADRDFFAICLKYREEYFTRSQKLLSMLPDPPNVDKTF